MKLLVAGGIMSSKNCCSEIYLNRGSRGMPNHHVLLVVARVISRRVAKMGRNANQNNAMNNSLSAGNYLHLLLLEAALLRANADCCVYSFGNQLAA